MAWALAGWSLYSLIVLGVAWPLGHSHAALWSIALVAVNLVLGQAINWTMVRISPEAAVVGDATRVLLRLVTLLMAGFLLEQAGIFPRRSVELWGWLLAGTLASLMIEIAVLLRITK